MEGINLSPEREIGSNNEEFKGHSQKKARTRGRWTPIEDEKLKRLVADYGAQNWNLHAQQLEGRSGKSCRLRWYNELDPRINKEAFTEIEEERLVAAHHLYGNKWSLIAKRFPGRTDNAVKNQWHVLMARKSKREVDGAYMGCRSQEISIVCSSSGESGLTADTNEQLYVNPDLCLSSSFFHGHDELIVRGVRGNTGMSIGKENTGTNLSTNAENLAGMSTGTENCTNFASTPENLLVKSHPNYEEPEMTMAFIDFMGVGSI
ncbi:Myb transcription factor [Rhynchospora pubera]|uniref:Myb transcription factor n=1 Tax=Rhynchospora pubera TaxID=906938 RepID=A0AAV8EG53_9POAL|nr:Myb transcription factor [Rhynchospora pubera]